MSDKEHEAYLTGIAENQSVVESLRAQLEEAQQRAVRAEAACAEIPEALAEYVKAAVAAEREACAKLMGEALRKARLSEAEWWFSAEVIQDEETGKYTTTIQEMEKRLAALREQGKVGKS